MCPKVRGGQGSLASGLQDLQGESPKYSRLLSVPTRRRTRGTRTTLTPPGVIPSTIGLVIAKVAMEDIKLLRPKDVRLGRENKDISNRLRSDLDKASKEYDRRFHTILDHPVD